MAPGNKYAYKNDKLNSKKRYLQYSDVARTRASYKNHSDMTNQALSR